MCTTRQEESKECKQAERPAHTSSPRPTSALPAVWAASVPWERPESGGRMSGELSGRLRGLALEGRASEAPPGTDAKKAGSASKAGLSKNEEEENVARRAGQRNGKTELRDLVDDVFLYLFQRLVKTDLKSLYALERSCRRLRRLAKHRAVYKAVTYARVDDGDRRWNPLSLKPHSVVGGRLAGFADWVLLLAHLLRRGAKLSILELRGPINLEPLRKRLPSHLRTLAIDQKALPHPTHRGFFGFRDMLGNPVEMEKLECLIFHVTDEIYNSHYMNHEQLIRAKLAFLAETCAGVGSGRRYRPAFFSPDRFPALRVLIICCEPSELFQECMEELRKSWEDTELVCLKTPLPQHSFLKRPKDQPPHPDLLRLSQRYDWAH